MTTLEEAEAAFEAAHHAYQLASQQADQARSHATGLKQRLASGNGADIAAADLASAEAAAEHAERVAAGVEQPLRELSHAVGRARADQACDETLRGLRSLGADVARKLDAVAEALAPFAEAAAAYDAYVKNALSRLGPLCQGRTDRFRSGPGFSRPTIDWIPLGECRAMSQLSTVLVPVAKVVRAPSFVQQDLKQLAAAAPTLPRDDR